jgi:hypothetical protein
MVWAATAVAGIGAVAGIIGSKKAGDASKEATAAASEASDAQIAFAQKEYDDWKEIYGPVEQNLAKYYDELTPELRATQGLEAFEMERNRAIEGLNINLAQRGIATSGIAGQIGIETSLAGSQERARIRAEAPMSAAREKLGFLNAGMGIDPANTLNSALITDANNTNANSMQASRAAGSAYQGAAGGFVNLAEELGNAFVNRKPPQPTPQMQ